MRNLTELGRLAVGVAVGSAMVVGTLSLAESPGAGERGGGCNCIDLWRPVICSNGVVYSNSCYASCAHATGCRPYGDDT
jgi:hypothetical protein